MKIYDCFSYLDEDFLLSLRLKILNNYIDYFVIIEGDKTWQNNKKELSFDIEKFKEFKEKIIYIPVTDMPEGDNPYLRENFQRNAINRGLVNAGKDDLIIISDLDEIPNPKKFKLFEKKMKFAVFKQLHFYYKLNLQSQKNPFWFGSRICVKKYLKSPQWLRNLKFKKYPFWRIDKTRNLQIIKNGGWHFAYLQTPENISKKIQSFAHGEFNKIDITNEESINAKIEKGQDIFNRNYNLKKIEIDSSFPRYILVNKNKLKKWIV